MRFVRAGIGLALLLLVACGQSSTPSVERASLASCDTTPNCTTVTGTCITVSCMSNACVTNATAGCCGGSNAKCDDGNPCTADTCVANACLNTLILPLTAGRLDVCYISAVLGGPFSGARIRDKYKSGPSAEAPG